MWSMQPTPGLKPACSFLKMGSMAPLSLIWTISLLGTERSVTLRQFVHHTLSPFLGCLTISPLHQSSAIFSALQILWNRSYNQSGKTDVSLQYFCRDVVYSRPGLLKGWITLSTG